MDFFEYRDGILLCEDLAMDDLAERAGTPFYVYSRRTIEEHYDRFAEAFSPLDPQICFSIKSCGNIHILRLLVQRGAGMDVVSGGELYRAMRAGVDADRVVYAGVGKTDAEIRQALEARIGWFNVESEEEFLNIASIAAAEQCPAQIALRVNPDVYDPKTHIKTSTGRKDTKFGVDISGAVDFFRARSGDPFAQLRGLHVHLGSPIYGPEPYEAALASVLDLVDKLAAEEIEIASINIGGGFAADYERSGQKGWDSYADRLVPALLPFARGGGQVIIEPGRTISANAGALVCRVQYVKHSAGKTYVIVDAGMSQLIRPTLYEAAHPIWPCRVRPDLLARPGGLALDAGDGLITVDVVGPICESSDYLAKDRRIPPVERGDLMCVFGAGAYGMVMASQYNATPRPPEILVDGNRATVIRRRETYSDLTQAEEEPVELS